MAHGGGDGGGCGSQEALHRRVGDPLLLLLFPQQLDQHLRPIALVPAPRPQSESSTAKPHLKPNTQSQGASAK
jgi:hypothetical protein